MPRQKIVIDPVTRIEGHSKISLHLDEQGRVQEAYFHVTQFRGFEKFCEGRPFYEMPNLMSRICGICPVSHLVASAKACDAIMAVRIPEVAVKLRRLINLAQVVQSHDARPGRDIARRRGFVIVHAQIYCWHGTADSCGYSVIRGDIYNGGQDTRSE